MTTAFVVVAPVQHVVVAGHEMPKSSDVPPGRVWAFQRLPPSVVAKKPPWPPGELTRPERPKREASSAIADLPTAPASSTLVPVAQHRRALAHEMAVRLPTCF